MGVGLACDPSPPRRGLEEDGQDDPGPYPARRSRGDARRRQADLHRSGPGGDQERVRRIVRLVSSLASSPRAKRASPGLSLPLGPLACLGGDPRAGPERARSSSCQVNSSKATGAKPLLGDTPSALAVGWPHGPVGGLERGKRRGPVPEAAPSAPRRRCRGPRGGGRRWRTVKVCRPRPRRLRLVWRMAGPRPRLVGLAAEPRGVRDRAPVASRPMCRGRDLVSLHRNPARVSFAFFRTAPTTLLRRLAAVLAGGEEDRPSPTSTSTTPPARGRRCVLGLVDRQPVVARGRLAGPQACE